MPISGLNNSKTTVSDYVTKAEESNRQLGTYNKSTLDMTDFLKLMAAQLANQDMTNPMSNGEMMQQLSQMASIQTMSELRSTINNMNDISITNYAASLVGKEVTMVEEDKDGKLKTFEGVIEGTGLYQGQTVVFVDGKAYPLSSIMAVGKIPEDFIENEKPGEGGDSGDVEKPDEGGDSGDVEKPDEGGDSGDVEKPGEGGDSGDVEGPSEGGSSGDVEEPGEGGNTDNAGDATA